MAETGPIYGIRLIDSLPLGGTMIQALPNKADLDRAKDCHSRIVAGYEVLLMHLHREREVSNALADKLARMTGRTIPNELADARLAVDCGEDDA